MRVNVSTPYSVRYNHHREECPMKTMLRLTLVALLMFVTVPVLSGEAVQMWSCSMEDTTTEEQVHEAAKKWLAAAKKIPGGENLKAFVYFPIAVVATGETDFIFMVSAPTFEEWGKFWDNYLKADLESDTQDLFFCPDSVLWEAIRVQ
jgi:hypothetical protein